MSYVVSAGMAYWGGLGSRWSIWSGRRELAEGYGGRRALGWTAKNGLKRGRMCRTFGLEIQVGQGG